VAAPGSPNYAQKSSWMHTFKGRTCNVELVVVGPCNNCGHFIRCRVSSVNTVTRIQAAWPWRQSLIPDWAKYFVTSTASRLDPPSIHPIKWAAGAFSLRLKRPGREVDHKPPPSSTENKT
jgi:hypothetical protein